MNRALHGSCHVPAGFAELFNEKLLLRGAVGDANDGRLVRAEAKGSAADPEGLGRRVAEACWRRAPANYWGTERPVGSRPQGMRMSGLPMSR